MVQLIFRLLINAFALIVVAYLVPGFMISSFWAALMAAIVIGIVNTFIKPILQLIALPLSILTFGITAFLINVLLLWASASVVPGFEIAGFATALIGSIVLTLVSWFLHLLAHE